MSLLKIFNDINAYCNVLDLFYNYFFGWEKFNFITTNGFRLNWSYVVITIKLVVS